jgi:hypothetical protein
MKGTGLLPPVAIGALTIKPQQVERKIVIRKKRQGEPIPWKLLMYADDIRPEIRKYLHRGEL